MDQTSCALRRHCEADRCQESEAKILPKTRPAGARIAAFTDFLGNDGIQFRRDSVGRLIG